MTDPKDRRQFVRLENSLPVMYWISPTTGPQATLTRNISGGGICLYVTEPLLPGTSLEVQFTLPGHQAPMTFKAEVVWCDQPASDSPSGHVMAGIRFTEITPPDRDRIIRYCMQRVPPKA